MAKRGHYGGRFCGLWLAWITTSTYLSSLFCGSPSCPFAIEIYKVQQKCTAIGALPYSEHKQKDLPGYKSLVCYTFAHKYRINQLYGGYFGRLFYTVCRAAALIAHVQIYSDYDLALGMS